MIMITRTLSYKAVDLKCLDLHRLEGGGEGGLKFFFGGGGFHGDLGGDQQSQTEYKGRI